MIDQRTAKGRHGLFKLAMPLLWMGYCSSLSCLVSKYRASDECAKKKVHFHRGFQTKRQRLLGRIR